MFPSFSELSDFDMSAFRSILGSDGTFDIKSFDDDSFII